jgi:AcrR family transcriptional regulator
MPDPGRDARRAERREEMLDAAIGVIRTEGPAASMEQLAAASGVSKPILYRHFRDRDGLVGAVAERFGGQVIGALTQALGSDADDPRELLRRTIDAYLAFVEQEPYVYRFLVQHAVPAGAASETIAGLIPRIGQQVALVLGEQLRAIGADSGAAEPWAYGMVGMVHMAGDWWLERQTMPRSRLVEYLTALLWDGLSHLAPR